MNPADATQSTVLLDERDSADYVRMRAELARYGYRDADHPRLKPGQRVRHRGEQYPEARDNGTAVLLAAMEKPDSSWSRSYNAPDIEVLVLKDRPLIEGMSRLSQWANYHTAEVPS